MKPLLCAALLALGACATGEQIAHVDIGMTRPQVVGLMGRPDGDRIVGDAEALTYGNRLMSGWSWDRADYHVILTGGRVSAYGPGVVRQNAGPNVLMILPLH